MGMTEESVAELRRAWCLAGTKKNQDVVLAAVLFDSIRGRVNPLCEGRVGLLVGIGAKLPYLPGSPFPVKRLRF